MSGDTEQRFTAGEAQSDEGTDEFLLSPDCNTKPGADVTDCDTDGVPYDRGWAWMVVLGETSSSSSCSAFDRGWGAGIRSPVMAVYSVGHQTDPRNSACIVNDILALAASGGFVNDILMLWLLHAGLIVNDILMLWLLPAVLSMTSSCFGCFMRG